MNIRKLFGLIIAFFLVSCGSANVKNFYSSKILKTANFVIIVDEEQRKSLEFRKYAYLIKQELSKYNYKLVKTKEDADYALYVKYGVDDGHTLTGGSAQSFSTEIAYYAFLEIKMIDLKNSTEKDPIKIFEGRSSTYGDSNDFNIYLECLIQTLFNDFPGVNGATILVENNECSYL